MSGIYKQGAISVTTNFLLLHNFKKLSTLKYSGFQKFLIHTLMGFPLGIIDRSDFWVGNDEGSWSKRSKVQDAKGLGNLVQVSAQWEISSRSRTETLQDEGSEDLVRGWH